MSTEDTTSKKRARRSFTEEFKRDAGRWIRFDNFRVMKL